MKKTIIQKFIAGLLTAAMVFTAAPEVGALTNTSITAYAKTEKATKVHVNHRSLKKKVGILVGKQYVDGLIKFDHMKAKAKYSFTTNSKNLSVSLDISTMKKWMKGQGLSGSWTQYSDDLPFIVNSKKPGTYKVTVKEYYNGRTRNLKTFNLYVYNPKPVSEYTAYVGNEFIVDDHLMTKPYGFCYWIEFDKDYFSEREDTEDVDTTYAYVYKFLKPKKEGTTQVKIYSILDKKGKKPYIVNVTIKKNNCKAIEYNYKNDAGNKNGNIIEAWYPNKKLSKEYETDLNSYFNIIGELKSEDIIVSDKVNVTSADESIYKIKKEAGDDEDLWYGKALKEGETSITITCGEQSLTIPVIVMQNHCKSIKLDDEYTSDGSISCHYLKEEYSLDRYYKLVGESNDIPVTDDVKITSANPSILKVKSETDEYTNNKYWYYKALKNGETSITITCGDQSLTVPFYIDEY